MKRRLLTGGAGFIGSHAVHTLMQRYPDDELIVVDALTYAGYKINLEPHINEARLQFHHTDILDIDSVFQCYDRIDSVIHFAAESHVDRSISDGSIFVKTNVLGTQAIIDAVREYKVPQFIHISTDEVYGSWETGAAVEDSPMIPSSPYAASKAGADCLVLAAIHTYDCPAIICRCTNNYGPRQFPEKLIPLMIRNSLANKDLPIYGDGLQCRDWIHVQDHVDGILAVMEKGRLGEVYNIGAGTQCTNLDLVKRILKQVDRPESLIRHVTDRLGHDRRYALTIDKINAECGWSPQIDFESGLAATIDWYVSNPEWVKTVSAEGDKV